MAKHQIQFEHLEDAIGWLSEMEEDDLEAAYQQFLEEQPLLFDFMIMVEETFEFAEDFSILMQYALIIWKSYHLCCGEVPSGTDKEVDLESMRLIDQMENGNPDGTPSDVIPAELDELQPDTMEFIRFRVVEDERTGLLMDPAAGTQFAPSLMVVAGVLHRAVHRPRTWVV